MDIKKIAAVTLSATKKICSCAILSVNFFLKIIRAIFHILWRTTKIVTVIATLFLIVIITLYFSTDFIVKQIINNSTDYLDLNAKVEDVDIRLLTQTVSLSGVSLKNPSGFIEKDAFTATKLEVKFDFFDKKNPVKRIYLQNPRLRLEGKFGKRILTPSIRRSNFFVIVRELLHLWDIDLERMMTGESKNFFEQIDTVEEKSKFIEKVGRIRIDNLHIENGMTDYFDVGSIVLHNDTFEVSDVICNVSGVGAMMKSIVYDVPTSTVALSKFLLKNPPDYPKKSALFVGKLEIKIGKKSDEKTGEHQLFVEKITMDSPVVRFEDKQGSMLGALGTENNLFSIFDSLTVFHRVNVKNMFNDDFEIAIRDKELKLPELSFGKTSINDVKVTCSSNDGFLISNVDFNGGNISLKNIRMNLAKIKAGVGKINIDSKNQLFTITNLSLRNPSDFPEENAFLMKEFSLSTNIKESNIRGNRVLVIEHLKLRKFFVRLDSRTGNISDLIGEENNLFALIEDFNSAAKSIPSYKDSVQREINEDKTKRPRKYIVKKITFQDGEIRLGPRGDAIKIPMETFSIDNLGVEEGGVMSDRIVTLLIREIALRAMESAEETLANEWGILLKPIVKVFHQIARITM